jgi:RNase H-fold protein (predicted Holliday junction resolvase)
VHAAPVRAIQGAPVTVTFTSLDSTGEPSAVDPGTVTVGVTAADGSTVVAGGAATAGTGATRTYTLSATHTANLDRLTVTWTSSAVTIGTTVVDVVGAVYATTAEIRAAIPTLADEAANPTATLVQARLEVEAMFERAIGDVLSFVPRFDTATMWHRGQRMLQLPHFFLRRVRWARYWYDEADYTEVEPTLLTGIQANEAGLALLYDDTESWPVGRLVVGYEHGMDGPPPDVKRQAIAAVRRQVHQARSAVDPRAVSQTMANGEVQRFPTPGLGPWVTGVPEVDEVIQWYKDAYAMTRVG